MKSTFPALVVLAACLVGLSARVDAGQPPADWGFQKPYAYIVRDGHRFSRTPEEHERDARYFRDLGFTHSLIDAAPGGVESKVVESRQAPLANPGCSATMQRAASG